MGEITDPGTRKSQSKAGDPFIGIWQCLEWKGLQWLSDRALQQVMLQKISLHEMNTTAGG